MSIRVNGNQKKGQQSKNLGTYDHFFSGVPKTNTVSKVDSHTQKMEKTYSELRTCIRKDKKNNAVNDDESVSKKNSKILRRNPKE